MNEMIHYSVIDKLSRQARVSYEDAKEALEMTEWDQLDAYVWLEARGKIGTLTEEECCAQAEAMAREKETPQAAQSTAPQEKEDEEGLVPRLLRMGRENRLVARLKGEKVRSISIWGMLFVLFIFRKLALIVFLVSLCLGVKFAFEGPNIRARRPQH